MKLLFISHKFFPDIGGIEVNSEILAGYFTQFGAQVKLLTWSSDNGESKKFQFEVIRNPSTKLIINAHKWADVVYENNPSLKLSWPLILTKKPNVVAVRTWISRMDGKMALQDKLKLAWLDRANSVIAVSQAVRKQTFQKAIVIGNPYRVALFRKLETVPKEKDFVFLGRLVSDKGADMAIKLIGELAEGKNETTLTIIGDGEDRMALEELTQKLNLKHLVTFTGTMSGESLVQTLNAHRFLIAPSRWKEPFGNIALEGLACGCIPIVSDEGGLVDAVGNAGLVFTRNDQDSLFSEVKKMLEDPDMQKEFKAESDQHLKNHHPETVARAYFNIIESAFAEGLSN